MTRTKQLMRENNAFERALSPEFNQVLTDMVVYLRSAPVSEYNQELVRRDIGRMFLDAQRRGDSPADVIATRCWPRCPGSRCGSGCWTACPPPWYAWGHGV